MRRQAARSGSALATVAVACALIAPLLAFVEGARAAEYDVYACTDYGNTAPVFYGSSRTINLSPSNECAAPGNTGFRALEINTIGNVPSGYGAGWTATTPSAALKIVRVYTPPGAVYVDCTLAADGYTARFFWGDAQQYGQQEITPSFSEPPGNFCPGYGILQNIQPSSYVTWAAGCYLKTICPRAPDDNELLYVRGIDLTVQENTGPTISPTGANNLWFAQGKWVRGAWPISFTANDPSGVCSTGASVDGHVISGNVDSTPDRSNWQQCPELGFDDQLDTTGYPDGPMSLLLAAANAPGVLSAPSENVYVDNQPVTLTLSGPSDAPATAGTQYIDATATAGPSGVSAIVCSLDGAAALSYPGPAAQIAVSGLGAHHLSCIAHNGAIDSSNALASSQAEGWNMTIRQPSVSTVSFARIADTLRCGKKRERVHVSARWIVERIRGHRVRVKVPAQTRTINVVRCHPRVEKRRVRIGGRWVVRRVVVLPRSVSRRTKRIRFGATTTIRGWLGTTGGDALGGQQVRIMSAADDGGRRFVLATTVTTRADGSWSARLSPGPSRLIRAVYGGSATVEPARSAPGHLIVPASLAMRLRPHVTRWGGTIRIVGRLRGGYVPRAGELVVLRIGWRGGSAEIGHLYARRGGRFSSPYTFLRGNGSVTYRLWAVTARESDYPYAPARSRTTAVTVRP